MFTLLTGKRPVEGKNISEIIEQVIFCKKKRITEVTSGNIVFTALSDVVFAMMENYPDKRVTIENVYEKLNDILDKHIEELTTPPTHEIPKAQQTQEYKKTIEFAQVMYKKCLKIIGSYLRRLGTKQVDKKIVFRCPNPDCSKKLHVHPHMVGMQGNCPRCRHPIVVELPY